MNNIAIGVKLVAGFVAVALIVVVVGLVGWRSANNLSGHIDEVGRVNMPAVNNLRIIEAEFETVVRSLRALVNPALGMEARQEQYQEIESARENYEKAWENYEALPRTEDETRLWASFEDAIQDWAEVNNQFLELSRELEEIGILNTEEFLGHLQQFRGDHYQVMEDVRGYVDFGIDFEGGDDPEACNFGVWLQDFDTDNQELLDILRRLQGPHDNFHGVVEPIRELADAGQEQQAREMLRDDMGRYADHVFMLFDELIDFAREANDLYTEMNRLIMVDSVEMQDRGQGLLQELIELNERQADRAVGLAERDAARGVTISLAGLAIGVILALGLGLFLTAVITRPLRKTVDFAEKVAQGSLDEELEVTGKNELGILAGSLRNMVSNLKTKIREAETKSAEAEEQAQKARQAMQEANQAKEQAEQAKSEGMLQAASSIEGIVERMTSASEELSAQVEQASRGADEQSSRAGEAATSMEEMNATVLEVAQNASKAAEGSDQARSKAQEGSDVVSRSVTAINRVQEQSSQLKSNMSQLGQQAEQIGKIMNVIEDIADQTNLLALNAAIEAARAGDAGRGFAVVADEVRKLAEKTMNATKEVGQAITSIQQGTENNIQSMDQAAGLIDEATTLVNRSGDVLQEIVRLVQSAADQVQAIATATEEQSTASEEINKNIEEVSRISKETSEVMTQSAQAIGELSQQAQELQNLVNQLKQG